MADEVKGTPGGAAEASKEPAGLKGVWEGEFFTKGLEKFDEATVSAAKKTDEDCPGCEKDRRAKEEAAAKAGQEGKKTGEAKKPPYKIIKVQGRDYAVESEEEYDRLASQGADYTKKTQSLADEKRALEGGLPEQLKSQIARFNELADRLEKGVAVGTRSAASATAEEAPAKDVPLEEEYGYDPEMVDPHVPKLAASLRTANKKLAMLEESNKLFFLDKVVQTIQGTLTQAVKQFPIENIKDEGGKSITWDQFVGTFKAMLEDPANNSRSIPEMATEAVRSIHLSQKALREGAASEAKSELPREDMPLEEAKAKFPALFARISDQAVAEHSAKAGELPPTPKSRGTEATAGQAEKKKFVEGRKFRDTMDDAFNDPEVLAGIT